MNIEIDVLQLQRERLIKVLEYLKSLGESQNKIVENICPIFVIDSPLLSHYKNGAVKYIPDGFLNALHDVYNINPNYIRLSSNLMFDVPGLKLSNFEAFVDSWDTVYREYTDQNGNVTRDKYLHFTLNKSFYDFLINIDQARLFSEEGLHTLDEEINILKKNYSDTSSPEEYVLLPRNIFIDILETGNPMRKAFYNLIDPGEHSHYIDE